MIPLTKLNKHVRQIRLHPHENEENTENHCWCSTHVYSKSSSSGLNNCTVQHRKNILDWKEWETHSKQKARLSYSDAKQEPKWCTHECFHRSQGSNSSHLLWKPTHPASGHSFPWLTVILNTTSNRNMGDLVDGFNFGSQYCIFNTNFAKKGPIRNINKRCGWTILNN